MLELFAQAEPLSGGAGWLGAGLLGAVLSWLLLVHLPSKDKQLKDLLESKDKQLAEHLRLNNEEHSKQINAVVLHCKEEMNGIHNLFRTEMVGLGEKIGSALSRAK